MNTWAAFLLGLATPLARKVLVALGVAVVTYTGVDLALQQILSQAQSAWGGMPSAVAAYLALSGVNTGLAMIGGALTARVALIPLKRLAAV